MSPHVFLLLGVIDPCAPTARGMTGLSL